MFMFFQNNNIFMFIFNKTLIDYNLKSIIMRNK